MINIRYHIVSITAVFLALGIGVALGSTFLDRATVNAIDNNVKSADQRIKETNAENDRLNEKVTQSKERDESLIVVGSEPLLDGELTDLPVLVVAAPGVDDGTREVMASILLRSGADLRGTLELSDKLAFTGDVDADLAADLEIPDAELLALRAAATTSIRSSLLAAGLPLDADGTATATDDAETTTTTTTTTTPGAPDTSCCTAGEPDGATPPTVQTLLDRGYLDLAPGEAYTDDDPILEETGYRYVFLGGPDLTAEQNQILLSILPSAGAALPATVVTASQAAPKVDEVLTPTAVALVRASEDLRARYNTVDNTDTFAGLVATVFTLRDVGEVDPGQYGQAEGASAVLPPPS